MRGVGIIMGVVHQHQSTVCLVHLIDDRRQSGYQIKIELALKPLLNDLHMQHTQKAAAEAEAQRSRRFGLKDQRCIVQLEFFKRVTQIGVFGAVLGINTAVDHRLRGTVTGQRLSGGTGSLCDGIAYRGVLDGLDGGGKITDLTCAQFLTGFYAQRTKIAALKHVVAGAGCHHLDLHSGTYCAVHNTEIYDNTNVRIVLAVKNKSLERCVGVAVRCGYVCNNILKHSLNVDALLGGYLGSIHSGQTDNILHLLLGLLRVGGRQVDLIENGQYLQIVIKGKICIGQGLCLHALRRINYQNSTLAGGKRAGNLIVKVHVTRGIDKIKLIGLTVLSFVVKTNGAGFDSYATLLFQVHIIQQLGGHFTLGYRLALFQQTVSQSGFAVIYVGNDRKITDLALVHHIEDLLLCL